MPRDDPQFFQRETHIKKKIAHTKTAAMKLNTTNLLLDYADTDARPRV